LLEYDDVMNKQREAVYGLRRHLLMAVEQRELILEDYLSNILSFTLDEFAPEETHPEQWNLKGLKERLIGQFGFDLMRGGSIRWRLRGMSWARRSYNKLRAEYEVKEKILGAEAMRYHERMVMLSGAGRAVEGSPAGDGPPEGGDRDARLCAAGSAGGIQERVLRDV
jgi:preprotein translocase subunit SecA